MTADHRRINALFTLAGAAAGVLLARLFFTDGGSEYGRTNLCASGSLTAVAAAVGWGVGSGLARLSASRPRFVGWVVTAGVMSLTGLLSAVAGWAVGDAQARNWVEHETLTRRSAAVGGMIGPLVGLLFVVLRWLKWPG